MKHQVVSPIERVKELILQEYPDFYELGEITQEVIVDEFVKPVDADIMLNYMIVNKQKCRVCGCTWNTPCEGGCYWVEEDLCSKCAEKIEADNSDKEMDCLACTLNKENACNDCCRDWDNEDEK